MGRYPPYTHTHTLAPCKVVWHLWSARSCCLIACGHDLWTCNVCISGSSSSSSLFVALQHCYKKGLPLAAKLFHALAAAATAAKIKTKDLGNKLAANVNFSYFMPIKAMRKRFLSKPGKEAATRPRTATNKKKINKKKPCNGNCGSIFNDKLARAKVSLELAKMSAFRPQISRSLAEKSQYTSITSHNKWQI